MKLLIVDEPTSGTCCDLCGKYVTVYTITETGKYCQDCIEVAPFEDELNND